MPEFHALIEGYRRFRAGAYREQRERWTRLAEGQPSKVMVIACSDSRVDPTRVFDAEPGQIFVLRNVANLVPPYEPGGGLHGVSAAIEFAVLGLKVSNIVVLGHAACGGISAALHGHDLLPRESSFITAWMGMIEPARAEVTAAAHADPQRALEFAAIELSLRHLMEFPFVSEAVSAGRLTLHGAHFGIAEGELRVLGPGGFVPA